MHTEAVFSALFILKETIKFDSSITKGNGEFVLEEKYTDILISQKFIERKIPGVLSTWLA